jgi:hypothetical protein
VFAGVLSGIWWELFGGCGLGLSGFVINAKVLRFIKNALFSVCCVVVFAGFSRDYLFYYRVFLLLIFAVFINR